jgi:hypothetical protein
VLTLESLVRELSLLDLTAVRRMQPLMHRHLAAMVTPARRRDRRSLMGLTMSFVGHDGLLRSGELCSGLLRKDVIWGNASRTWCLIYLARSKCNRTGGGEWIRLDDYGGVNAVVLLREWWDTTGEELGPEDPLFPSLRGRRSVFVPGRTRSSISTTWLRRFIKAAVCWVGLDPSVYSGHSLRAGGATDLFVAGVPYHCIKRKGRWLSDAAMLYYRDMEDVDAAVRAGFRSRAAAASF